MAKTTDEYSHGVNQIENERNMIERFEIRVISLKGGQERGKETITRFFSPFVASSPKAQNASNQQRDEARYGKD
jgi:hypothetical protein